MTSTNLRVIPAQLAHLSIYNPSLGPTDETFPQQIVYHFSRTARDARLARKDAASSSTRSTPDNATTKDELKEEENERLRQIGLAQGMVGFARTFAEGKPVEAVETEKSRVVIKELEEGWWVLASVDLTRLPKAKPASALESALQVGKSRVPGQQGAKAAQKGAAKQEAEDGEAEQWEYSAREVASPALLAEQIIAAHRTFCLHHGPSLTQLLTRGGRVKLCDALDRFWSRFCRYWEVLLHGNPAVDVLGGIKLSAGGELGMGVGEEDWGSGEREVLEGLVHRTDGLVDLVVSRFGEAPVTSNKSSTEHEAAELPWIGKGRPPEAEDGVIFGGIGNISRSSIRDVSSWMQQIYVYGDYAYGVRDNPSRKRRKIRGGMRTISREPSADPDRATKVEASNGAGTLSAADRQNGAAKSADEDQPVEAEQDGEALDKVPSIPALPPDPRPTLHDRVASQDHAPGSQSDIHNPQLQHKPGIPPPIVHAAEDSLNKALQNAKPTEKKAAEEQQAGVFGISNDRWVKYLTLGLSEIGKTGQAETASSRPGLPAKKSTAGSLTQQPNIESVDVDDAERSALTHMDPTPDGSAQEFQLAEQRRLENQGYFLIGYRGSLQEQTNSLSTPNEENEEDAGERLLLRTIHLEVIKKVDFDDDGGGSISEGSSMSTFRNGMTKRKNERLRVVVYIRRPFIYAFMFEQRAETLQMSAFYKGIHQHLAPLLKPLGSSTSAANVSRRIEESGASTTEPESPNPSTPSKLPKQSNAPVYDLLFDPVRLTIHSSIPNIPSPGTPAAEGIALTSAGKQTALTWSRIEGLNVHSQILNTLESTRDDPRQIERSAKSSRGWWVMWMRLPPSPRAFSYSQPTSPEATADSKASSAPMSTFGASTFTSRSMPAEDYSTADCRVAVLVRKASDWVAPKTSASSSRFGSGMFGLGRAEDATGGSNAGWGSPGNIAGGMGFDARRYVEGLLSLSR